MNAKNATILHQGRINELYVSQPGPYNHFFGGVNNLRILDFPNRERPLHQVLSLDLNDPELNISIGGITQLPLLYRFVFDGCTLKYQVASNTSVVILDLTPSQSSDGWPYPEYPRHFNRVPLKVGRTRQADREAIDALTWWQFDDSKPDNIWLNIPPSSDFGGSLWGPDGDAMAVEVVFQIDPVASIISVKNECS